MTTWLVMRPHAVLLGQIAGPLVLLLEASLEQAEAINQRLFPTLFGRQD